MVPFPLQTDLLKRIGAFALSLEEESFKLDIDITGPELRVTLKERLKIKLRWQIGSTFGQLNVINTRFLSN